MFQYQILVVICDLDYLINFNIYGSGFNNLPGDDVIAALSFTVIPGNVITVIYCFL